VSLLDSALGKALGAVLAATVLFMIGFQATHYRDFWDAEAAIELATEDREDIHEEVNENESLLNRGLEKQDILLQRQAFILRWMTTQQGRATQLDPEITFHEGVHINTRGLAEQHLLSSDEIIVTNVDHPDQPSITTTITGTFRNNDRGHLLILGSKAARALRMAPGTTAYLTVRVEPFDDREQ
jgi:hypothetical protein